MLPRSFRGEDPAGEVDVNDLPVYVPPSMLVEYKWLAVLMVVLGALFATYCYRSRLKPPEFPNPIAVREAHAKDPVYVTPLIVPTPESQPAKP